MQRSFAELHRTCFQGATLLHQIETPALAEQISSLNAYDLQNLELFIHIIFELNCGKAPGSFDKGFRRMNSAKRVNAAVMNDKGEKSPLDDGHAGRGRRTCSGRLLYYRREVSQRREPGSYSCGRFLVMFPTLLSVSGRCLHMSPQFVEECGGGNFQA